MSILCSMVGASFTVAAEATAFTNDANTMLLLHMNGTDASTTFTDDNLAAAAQNAVSFDGTDDYYSVTGLTTTASDSKYLTIAFTWYHESNGNSRNQHFMTARLGTANGENGWEVCIQSGRFRYSSYDNSGSSTDMVYGDYSGPTQSAWNQIVAYVDHTSFANCKYYLNGVDRTSNLLNGGAIGAVNLSNNNINWGSSNVSIKIGEQDATAGYNSGFSDFQGRISQIYVHNASGAPDITKFWSGGPRDLGTNGTATGLAQPLIYHYGSTSTFATNNGTGFNSYTLTANGGVATAQGPQYAARLQKTITAVGNAQIDTAQSKFGGASGQFDGSGDYLTLGASGDFNFGSGDFTIEGWIRPTNNLSGYKVFYNHNDNGTDRSWITIQLENATVKSWATTSTGSWNIYSDLSWGTVSLDTWYHIALVRDGNTMRAYKDGVQINTASVTSWTVSNQTAAARIGAVPANQWFGWVDEFRISNTCRYPNGTTFTPNVSA